MVMLIRKKKYIFKIFNKILANLEKEKISNITQFKKVDRADIIAQNEVFTKMENELFIHFDKIECGWYSRNQIINYNIIFFKKAIKILGYKLVIETKVVRSKLNGKKITTTHTMYSIDNFF